MSQSFVSPKLKLRPLPNKGGYGVFAIEPIQAGERLVVWGGDIIFQTEIKQLPAALRHFAVQVEEDLFLAPRATDEPEMGDFINHSCDPNAGFEGQIVLRAMRAITPGDEICIDYAMCDGEPYDEFECQCGTARCRGRVSGKDWQLADLQNRYRGFFVPYLQRRIEENGEE